MRDSDAGAKAAFFVLGLAVALLIWFAVTAVLALLLQFAYGWAAASFHRPAMPFWVAFAVVVVASVIFKGSGSGK